ncbi:hypothetical protein C8F04DRAFT_1288180 [Mycena alexandri]|uniref:Uncharacterized protein n=1 Tax=Mycena alexandri TaxID=1745969 RepID=A0AAD6SL96_9AGAR|nr:hypothetical protein C8F04DRAFT_1288180 [Mycena alexandri]
MCGLGLAWKPGLGLGLTGLGLVGTEARAKATSLRGQALAWSSNFPTRLSAPVLVGSFRNTHNCPIARANSIATQSSPLTAKKSHGLEAWLGPEILKPEAQARASQHFGLAWLVKPWLGTTGFWLQAQACTSLIGRQPTTSPLDLGPGKLTPKLVREICRNPPQKATFGEGSSRGGSKKIVYFSAAPMARRGEFEPQCVTDRTCRANAVMPKMPGQAADNLIRAGSKKVENPPEKAKSRRRVVKFWPQKAKIRTRKSQNLALKKPNFRTSFGVSFPGPLDLKFTFHPSVEDTWTCA